MHDLKTILTIAGSDSIGGAGIQTDIRTSAALGVYAMTAVTAVTAQNSSGVAGYEAVSPDMLRLQLETVVRDVVPDAVKIGMVPDVEHARVIADFLAKYRLRNVVVDPVMSATSGKGLSSSATMEVMMERVMPMATLVTPNLPEIEWLTGLEDGSRPEREWACRQLMELTDCPAVLLKGGHGEDGSDILLDLLAVNQDSEVRLMEFSHPRIETRNTHGTGCTLSTAIASFLARGLDLAQSVKEGIEFLLSALKSGESVRFGVISGHGPAFFGE